MAKIPSPLLMLKIAFDELACAARRMLTRPLLEVQWRRIVGEVEDAVELFAREGWFDTPRLYHADPGPPRRVKVRRSQCLGLDVRQLGFPSDYEPHHGEPGRSRWMGYGNNRTAHAWVVRHGGRPRPWLVCIPGYGMGTPYVDLSAFYVPWLFSGLGLNVLIPVLPLHGPRRLQRLSGGGFFGGDYLDTIHAEAQAVYDIRQLIVWLREQDAPSIGLYGLSLGGYTAAILAGLEAELACVIAGIAPSSFARLAQLHTPLLLRKTAETLGLDWDKVERLFRVVSPLAFRPRVPKECRYIFGAVQDRIVPRGQVKELWYHWDHPRMLWYSGGHLSFYWEQEVRDWIRLALRESFCAPPTKTARASVSAPVAKSTRLPSLPARQAA